MESLIESPRRLVSASRVPSIAVLAIALLTGLSSACHADAQAPGDSLVTAADSTRADTTGAPGTRTQLPPSAAHAWQTGVLSPDHLQHASLAFSSGVGMGLVTREPALAASFAMGLGIVKELWDQGHDRIEVQDLVADAIGAGLAALATHSLGH